MSRPLRIDNKNNPILNSQFQNLDPHKERKWTGS